MLTVYLLALGCVLGLAAGQVLFKQAAIGLSASGTLWSAATLVPVVAAITLYGASTVAWIWTLQHAQLGRLYPLMALGFVLVPVASHFVFGERFTPQYMLGVAFILIGVVLASRG
ncbi:4-amino-4-deoxy-L-arabinose-phospho-UDP flippase [Pseudorhodoferax sp.]|uniref:4-amino-4-deoxy-L-arabinose-phospho-UDP flippase n=1 Tax=Pseudorhodoferax sp. TaxID=1993553 RepID=UPI002DD696CA|nr:4-amino-4-deoxy-L-arabinose-phospho-UDP flippase [Pseudorhodoferax sp.]